MAKKKLSIDDQIKRYKKKKRFFTFLKIAIAVVALAIVIPTAYFGYYYVMFNVMAQNDYNPDKINGIGYCRPLNMIRSTNPDTNYVLAYYINGKWNVVEDTQKLRDNIKNFVIYKEDEEWHEGSHCQLILIKDTYMYDSIPLTETTMIDDRCFRGSIKKMTMEEFENYIAEKGYTSVFIK